MTASLAKYQNSQTTQKTANIVIAEAQRQIIQKNFNTLVDWSEKWQMKFNLDKCHVLHIENYNPLTSYSMKDVQLKSVDKESRLRRYYHK